MKIKTTDDSFSDSLSTFESFLYILKVTQKVHTIVYRIVLKA